MKKKGLGWVPDYPDIRDYRIESKAIRALTGDSDRTDDRIKQLTETLHTLKTSLKTLLSQEQQSRLGGIDELHQKILEEAEQKISFRSAELDSNVLAYGCTGEAVHALREKLRVLKCHKQPPCTDPNNVIYDRALEAAVKDFQKKQNLSQTGIASSVTLAKIAALSEIAIQARKDQFLTSGEVGPGIIYLQQKLLTLRQQGELAVEIDDEEVLKQELNSGAFGTQTAQLVRAFQKKVFPDDETQWDCIVGQKTGKELRERFEGEVLFDRLMAPIPLIYFEIIKTVFLDILSASSGEPLPENFCTSSIAPLIEVAAQLLPFLHGYDHQAVVRFLSLIDHDLLLYPDCDPGGKAELQKGLTLAYEVLKHYRLRPSERSQPLPDRLTKIAQRLRGRRGYFPSRELDARIYQQQDEQDGIDQRAATIYIQERLRYLGFYKAPTTGYFEELTKSAVQSFQKHFNLELKKGTVDHPTRHKLLALSCEAVQTLDPLIPKDLSDLIQKRFITKDHPEIPPDLLRSIVLILAQMVMPIGDPTELESRIQENFEKFQAIAQYSLINHAMTGAAQTKTVTERNLKHWWKTFSSAMQSRQTQRILEVLEDHDLLDRFEAPIMDAIRALPSQNEGIIQVIYGNLCEELAELLSTIKTANLSTNSNSMEYIKALAHKLHELIKVEKVLEDPSKLPEVEPRKFRQPTFVRLDQGSDGRLQVSMNAHLNKTLKSDLKVTGSVYLALPEAVDLSFWCSPIEDQGAINACTANAGVALLEYFQRRSFGQHLDASRRFLYKVSRNLMQREGDFGSSVRETMRAMVLFGVPPEEFWPYQGDFEEEPPAFCYTYAQNYQTIHYFRLDGSNLRPNELLAQIKLVLIAGFPCMFGFTLYSSMFNASNPKGHIPFPTLDEKREGGHAMVAVGYSDYLQIKNAAPGAFLVRNSWGTDWGDRGYGWLPYDYVLEGLARDWWSLIRAEWVETGSFGAGPSLDRSEIGGSGSGKGDENIR
jgi:C1A family cysteine protease/peptidoglycan hydrolase-like protein with peptidoglycan-binding domain